MAHKLYCKADQLMRFLYIYHLLKGMNNMKRFLAIATKIMGFLALGTRGVKEMVEIDAVTQYK